MMLEGTATNEIPADKLAGFDSRLSVLEDSMSRLFNALAGPGLASLSKSKP